MSSKQNDKPKSIDYFTVLSILAIVVLIVVLIVVSREGDSGKYVPDLNMEYTIADTNPDGSTSVVSDTYVDLIGDISGIDNIIVSKYDDAIGNYQGAYDSILSRHPDSEVSTMVIEMTSKGKHVQPADTCTMIIGSQDYFEDGYLYRAYTYRDETLVEYPMRMAWADDMMMKWVIEDSKFDVVFIAKYLAEE